MQIWFAALGGRGGFFFNCSLVGIAVWVFLFWHRAGEMKVFAEALYPGPEMIRPRVSFWSIKPL